MKLISRIFETFLGIKIVKFKTFQKLYNSEKNYTENLKLLEEYKNQIKKIIQVNQNLSIHHIECMKSQNLQDIVTLDLFGFKKDGYFIEAGACDGKLNSNTFLLEKKFSWNGLLVEPLKLYFDSLQKNRTVTTKNYALTALDTKEAEFLEVKSNDLSTLKGYEDNDYHSENREKSKIVLVKTISLQMLMTQCKTPFEVDFLSLDTEGSEYDILKDFDFKKYQFNVICVEHNFSSNRKLMSELLVKNGYKKIYFSFSNIDDYYINNNFEPLNKNFSFTQ